MNAIKYVLTALIPAVLAVIADFFLFFLDLKITGMIVEQHIRSLFPLSLALIVLCGIVFIFAQILTGRIVREKAVVDRKKYRTARIAGAVIYALLMTFVFPCSPDILFGFLPKSELCAGLILLFFQISAYIAAAICVFTSVMELRRTKGDHA